MAVASWQTDSVESGNIVGDGAAFSPTSLAAWRVAQETLDPDERETVDPADVWAAAASPPLSPEVSVPTSFSPRLDFVHSISLHVSCRDNPQPVLLAAFRKCRSC